MRVGDIENFCDWLLVQDRSDGVMESSLFMRQAIDASFRTYTLHAENSVGVTTADVKLFQSMHCERMSVFGINTKRISLLL